MTGEPRPDQRADAGGPPLGGGTPDGGVPDSGGEVDPGFDIDIYGGTGMTNEERAVRYMAATNAALGGFGPTISLGDEKPMDKTVKHGLSRKLRAEVRRHPKKGRMVPGGRVGRTVN